MLSLIVPIGSLLTGVALLLLGSGLLNTLLALRGGIEGYSDATLGIIMSGYFLGFFVGTFVALPLIQRIGHIRTFALCAALASCSVLLHVLVVRSHARSQSKCWIATGKVSGAGLLRCIYPF